MGKALSTIRQPLRNFNVEDRAHKVISRDKPIPAPKYQSDVVEYERILKEHPDIVKNTKEKHSQLDDHLRNVFVTSYDPEPRIIQPKNPNRPLPEDKSVVEFFEMGFKEPGKVPLGKATLRTVMKFIGMYQNNPKYNTAQKIADEYDLDVDRVSKILKYVQAYEVYIPESNTKTKARFAGPSFPRTTAKRIQRNLLPVSKKKDSDGDT